MGRVKSKNFCFTINNATDEDFNKMVSADWKYLIYGYETGDEGTDHIQGYMHFANQRHFNKVIKLIPRAHFEICKGTIMDNIEYCSKDGDYIEYGERPVQGRRTDLEEIRGLIEKKTPQLEIAKNYFSQWCQYRHSFSAYQEMLKNEEYNKLEEIETIDCQSFVDASNRCGYANRNEVYVQQYHGDYYNNQEIAILVRGSITCNCILFGYPAYISGKMTKFKKVYIY